MIGQGLTMTFEDRRLTTKERVWKSSDARKVTKSIFCSSSVTTLIYINFVQSAGWPSSDRQILRTSIC